MKYAIVYDYGSFEDPTPTPHPMLRWDGEPAVFDTFEEALQFVRGTDESTARIEKRGNS